MWYLFSKDGEAEFRSLMTEIETASDRAAAIVAATCVEEQLAEVLQGLMEKDEVIVRKMFRSTGPLGSFSAKISMGYLLRLYGKDMHKELDTIKTIRNLFAHQRLAKDFESQRARTLANNLSISETLELFTPRLDENSQPAPDLKVGDVVWLGFGIRKATDSRERGPAKLPLLEPGTVLSPRQKYIRACQFYVTYLMFVLFSNLGEEVSGVGRVFPRGALPPSE